jgi:hypothetical protein
MVAAMVFGRANKVGLVRYDVSVSIPYWGYNQIPVESVRSAIQGGTAEQIQDLSVFVNDEGILAVGAVVTANSPLKAASLLDERLLEAIVATGQAEEFNASMRTVAAAPTRT